MNLKKYSLLVSFVLIIGLFSFNPVYSSQVDEFIDSNIPESWYEAPKTASQIGITQFEQSPILDERVENGELPPVEERLPKDPPVREPYQDIGQYGGTVTIWDTGFDQWNLNFRFWHHFSGGRPTPDGKVVPYYFAGWDYSDDYTSLTINLREGLKWSHGKELTADDYIWWWKHYANNEDLSLTPPEEWDPPLMNVTKEGPYKVTFHYGEPVPNQYLNFNASMGIHQLAPGEYMQQFHPDFNDKEKLEEMAEEVDLDRWDEYYDRVQDNSNFHPDYQHRRPTLRPYIPVERTETHFILERNPYYPFVDPEGNQLPYVDRIRINLANSEEMAATKAATGDATFGHWFLNTSDIPLYKRNEADEDYKTLIYQKAGGNEPFIRLNLSTTDEKLKNIFLDFRFRKALSLAIHRDNINNKVFYGHATPRQMTVPPASPYFEKRFAEAYIDYDPEKSRELLEEMGLTDINDDGYRETSDGEPLELTLTYCKYDIDPTSVLELVRKDFENIGINMQLQMVSRGLHEKRWQGNTAEMGVWGPHGLLMGEFIKTRSSLGFLVPIAGGIVQDSAWPSWITWFDTKGEEGVEPPAEIKELNEHARTVVSTTDKQEAAVAIEKILESQAENLWTIGTVGLIPKAMIVSNSLKNVPEKGLFSWPQRFLYPYCPEQFYFDEDNE